MSLTRPRTTLVAFAEQAREHLEGIRDLLGGERPPADSVVERVTTATRSLRGNASLLGLDSCQGFLGRLFHLLEDVSSNEMPWSHRLQSILREAAEAEERYVQALELGDTNPGIDDLLRVETLLVSWKKQESLHQEDSSVVRDDSQRGVSQSAVSGEVQECLQEILGTVEKLRESAQSKSVALDTQGTLEELHRQLSELQTTVAQLAVEFDKLPDDSESGLRNHCEGGLHQLVESAAREVLDEARECGVRLGVRAMGCLDIDEDELGGAILDVLRNLWSDSLKAQAVRAEAKIDTVVRDDEERLLIEVRDPGMRQSKLDATSSEDDVLGRYPGLRRLRPLLESMQGLVDVEPSRIEGCRFRVSLPRTRQQMVTRIVRVGAHEVAIAASAIDSVHKFGDVQVSQDESGAMVRVEGRDVPLMNLAVMSSDPSFDEMSRELVVVVGSFERRAAIFASGPIRTATGTLAAEVNSGWLSTLQCGDEAVEFIDTGALLGRRKARVNETPEVNAAKRDSEASTLFITRDLQQEQESLITRTVLVVNSSEVEGAALSTLLKESSFKAITARTGAEALEILRTESIDLMVCDLRLPEMNAQQISEHRNRTGNHAEVPVLLVLSHAGDQSHLVAQQLGAVDHVRSPVNEDEFVMVVKRLMDAS